MSRFNHKKTLRYYNMVAALMLVIIVCIQVKASYIMIGKRDYWQKVADRVKRDSVEVIPSRGNILSCDGELLASSLPEFKIAMDFNQLHVTGRDTLWHQKLDSICDGLHQIFPERSAAEFRAQLEEGRKKLSKNWPIWPSRINYNTYSQVKQLPVFRLDKYKGGFHYEEFNARERPYGSLGMRTIGSMYAAMDDGRTPRCGLELSYDSLLRGTSGIKHRRKVLNKYLDIIDTAPIAGADIITTIDVGIQDLAERAVIDELKQPEVNGNVGVAIVMEVKTGDIKAIVNMEKCVDGEYREIKNHAVSDLLEPGSVFKPISIMTCLEDGMCDTNKIVDTGGGVWPMYGREMRDHNWRRGGYGVMNLPKTLKVSSNVGVSRIVDEYYHKDPEKFVRGVKRSGIDADLHIPIKGATKAWIRMPQKNKRGEWTNWSNTALPWMSIGYETQIPPISTLTFYNAIANGGKMMQPRFVKAAVKNGEVVEEFPPQVVEGHEQIASPRVIKLMQEMLRKVVSEGLGRKAGSESFQVSGKTGTAQISQGAAGYKNGPVHYLLSFAGYFPSDAPRYSCIVCIQKTGLPASGGGMSGVVFHHIAEGIMAQSLRLNVSDARDSTSVFVPDVKEGNILSANYVLSALGIKTATNFSTAASNLKAIWGQAEKRTNQVILRKTKVMGNSYIPDVTGMGARDAVYLIEKRGVKCRIVGRGKVTEQSLPPGHYIKKGEVCTLKLD
jgi:cell division protein FtsI (penicillin-binding protein 3)